MSRNFYIAVTQQVLFFGAETWVLTKRMEAAPDAFQGRVARRLMGRTPHRGRDGKWLYLPLAGATKEAGIVRARTSVLQRQNTVAQFVATRPIMVLCEGTEQQGGGHGSPKDGQLPSYPALERIQGIIHPFGKHPGLRPEEEDLLCHGNI